MQKGLNEYSPFAAVVLDPSLDCQKLKTETFHDEVLLLKESLPKHWILKLLDARVEGHVSTMRKSHQ